MSEKHNTLESFKKVLIENGAEFSDSFVSNLLRIIQHMKPKKSNHNVTNIESIASDDLSRKFPGLAIPNKPTNIFNDGEIDDEKENVKEDIDIVADLMAQFEADAPSKVEEVEKKEIKKKSPSVERKRESRRSRSRNRGRSRSRNRDRSRSRHRRSRSRHRDKSREHYRHKSRDNYRRRDRSHERYERSRNSKRSDSDRHRNRSREKKPKRDSPELDDDPVPGKVKVFFNS